MTKRMIPAELQDGRTVYLRELKPKHRRRLKKIAELGELHGTGELGALLLTDARGRRLYRNGSEALGALGHQELSRLCHVGLDQSWLARQEETGWPFSNVSR